MSGTFWKPAPVAQLRDDNEERNQEDVVAAGLCPKRRGPLQHQRMLLPIYKHKRQILYAVENYGIVVIVGETGSGKSTQIPQYLVEGGGWTGHDFTVVCTQPRRIAATSLATRVAQEMGTKLGDIVGYTVRFDDQSSPQTQIKYVTDGILLREATLHDPLLSNYSVIILDETHERNLNTDTLLGLVKKIRRKRKDLRLIICSATIDAQRFLDFFVPKSDEEKDAPPNKERPPKKKSRWGPKTDGNDDNNHDKQEEKNPNPHADRGTIISVDGRQHSVDVLHRLTAASNYIDATIDACAKIHKHESPGDVLCFLPTGEDIDRAIRLAEEEFESDMANVEFLPLYGTLPQHVQSRIFQAKLKESNRRFIFATNIAETSVTVPNIAYVVDAGLVKLPYFDPVTGLERLIVHETSKASAAQRCGRAGRVRAGKCFRLYTEKFWLESMKDHTPPEILRTNLTSFILTLKALGVDNILAFDLMDLPSVDALSHGLETLYSLGALDDKTNLTDLGRDLSAFPTEPRVSRMLLESINENCSWEVLGVAGAMQVRDLLHKPHDRRQQAIIDYNNAVGEYADPSGDHVTFVNLLSAMEDEHWNESECRERFMNYMALRRALEVRRQLAHSLRQFGRVRAMGITDGTGSERSRAIRRCVTAGFFGNVAKLDNDGRYYTLRKRVLVTPSGQSILMTHSGIVSSEYIVFGETIDGSRGGIELKIVSKIEAQWLRELAPHYKNKDNNNYYNNKGEKHSTRNDKPNEQPLHENHETRKEEPDAAGNEQNKTRKRRRHEQREPRRSRPTPQALDLSSRLQDLSRQKNLKELTQLFWKKENDKIRDSHHVCIVVDCCSRCGDVATAEKAFASLGPGVVTVETKTALLKCYAHSGELHKAMVLFREMCQTNNNQQKPNVRTLNTLLRGCLWTAATKVVDEKGKAHIAGGVVSSEEGWILYQNQYKGEENNMVDTSSYEIAIILLCQALRVEQAQARIQQLQEQYQIKCKGKASIKGGDQGSLETCGIAYLSLARALALLGRTDDMWLACQRCLHAIQASLAKLEQDNGNQSKDQGGKRAWKVDALEDQKRAASNLAYRKHRLTEVENEARALLKRRNSAKELSSSSLIPRLQSKLLYFTGGGTINSASTVSENKQGSDAVWHSFGLEELVNKETKSDTEKQALSAYRPPLTKHGYVDLSKVFSKERKRNVTDIEIGSGFGDWIVRQALSFPDRNHFAVELRADRVSQIFSRGTLVGAEPMENLCTVGGDSGAFLRDSIAKGTIASVFCNHPEPPTQTLGQNLLDLEGLMNSSEDEPVHMLNSTTLGHATEALVQGGRLVVVTDNRNYGNLLCATIVRLVRNKKGGLRCLEHSQAKKMKLKQIESFPEHVVLYEGQPCLQLGHARDDMLAGQSYFDRLWKTGAGSHSETSRRYLIVMYKQ